jgi:CubicO group peptidase (beta-lactamase class C family)
VREVATTTAPARLDEIAEIVRREQGRHPIPGVAIGIASADEDTTAAFGVTNVDHPVAVDRDTLFQIGSITKTFLGTAVMRLADKGTLDLDTPIRRWIPDLRLRDADAAADVTLTHCLTHTAGWFGDHFEDFGTNDDALERYLGSLAELEQQVPLGTEWAYNNAAFCLAGRVVEVVTGRPIETAMRDLVFAPLGLERTFFFASEVITHRVASGHNSFDGVPRVARPWAIPRAQNAAGGIVSTVPDLLRYARFHMGDGTAADGSRVLSSASMDLMRSPLVKAALGLHRGIAWQVEDQGGVRVIGHGGATIGQQALLSIAPARRAAIAMLTNSNEATQLQNAMSRWWSERYLGVPRKEPVPLEHAPVEHAPLEHAPVQHARIAHAPVQHAPVAPAAVEHSPREHEHTGHDPRHCPLVIFAEMLVTGTYRNPANDLRIALEQEGLVVHRTLHGSLRNVMEEPPPQPKPERAAFSGDDRLMLLGGPLAGSQIELLGDGSRPVDWIRFQSRLYRRDRP